MQNRWRNVKVEELADRVAMGPFGSDIKTDNFVSTGVPIIRGNNLTTGRFNSGRFAFLTESKADELKNSNAFPGDLVFTHRGTLGQVGMIPLGPYPRYVVSQSQMVLSCARQIADPLFLFYFFKSPNGQHQLLANTSQTGVPAISRPVSSLKAIIVLLPPLSEQRAIASVLGSLDDKIELNRRMNETLEILARSIFKQWFLDAVEGGLPTGWRECELGDVVDIKHGYAFPGEFFRDEPCRDVLLTPGSFAIGGGFKADKSKYYEGPAPEEYVLSKGDLLITMTDLSKAGDTLGYGALLPAPPAGHRFLHNQRLGKVLISNPNIVNKEFLFELLRTTEYRNEVLASATGSTVKHTSPGRIKAFRFVLPEPKIMQQFGELAGNLYALIGHKREESRTLAALRDALLPKLLSGEIRLTGK